MKLQLIAIVFGGSLALQVVGALSGPLTSIASAQNDLSDDQALSWRRELDDLKRRTRRLEDTLEKDGSIPKRLPSMAPVSDQPPAQDPPNAAEPAGAQISDGDAVGARSAPPSSDAERASLTDGDIPEGQRLEDLEQSMKEMLGESQDFVEALSSESSRVVNGRLHLDYWTFPQDSAGTNIIQSGNPLGDPQDRFQIRRVRMGIRGKLPPDNVSYRIELEYSGQFGGRIRDAWLGVDELVFFRTLRLGNQKRPYGLDHLNSSNFNLFMERPFINESFNHDNRRLGLVSYGSSQDVAFNWRYGLFAMTPIQGKNQIIGDTYQPEWAGRLAHTWWYDESSDGRGYGHWAIASSIGFPDGNSANNGVQDNQSGFRTEPEGRTGTDWLDTGPINGADRQEILAFESVFNAGPWQIAGELMSSWVQRDPSIGNEVQFFGGYAYVSFFLTGEHIPWDRRLGILGRLEPLEDFFCVSDCNGALGRGIGAWEVAARYSYADLNDADILGGIGESIALVLNWYWNSHTRLQASYTWGQIDDRLTQLSTGVPTLVSGDYQLFGTRFIVDF